MKYAAANANATDCFDLSALLPDGADATVSGGDWSGDGSGNSGRNWDFQTSTLLVEHISTNNVTDMFPPRRFTMEWLRGHAASRFGGPNATAPRPLELVTEWGFQPEYLASSGGSRIIFTNGLNDGWSAGGVKSSLSDDLIAINIDNGAHHSDLSFDARASRGHRAGGGDAPATLADDGVTRDLLLARESITDILTKWLVDDERRASDDNHDHDSHNNVAFTKVVAILGTLIAVLILFLVLVVLRLFSTNGRREEIKYELVYDMPHVVERVP